MSSKGFLYKATRVIVQYNQYKKNFRLALYHWISPIVDPLKVINSIKGYRNFFVDRAAYSRLPLAEPLAWSEIYPMIHDKTKVSTVDAHYFYVNAWAARRIVSTKPAVHVDVASQTVLSSLLGATIPVVFLDYRPLNITLSGMNSLAGNILKLPFTDNSIMSLSCLHVAEHIGLGRYGDPLDPLGTIKASRELSRVLAPGGNLFFAVPIGRERVQFNAHRIHHPETIRDYFSELELVEFSGVDDNGQYLKNITFNRLSGSNYACGFSGSAKRAKKCDPF